MASMWTFAAWFLAVIWQCRLDSVICQMNTGDQAVLLDLLANVQNKDALGWATDADPCSWKGIVCSGRSVSSINLANKGLGGTLTPKLNQLSALTSISLQGNGFTGTLPSLNGLTNLQSCYLDDNDFDTIPSDFFTNLPNLLYIYMNDNSNLNSSSLAGGWSIPLDLASSSMLTNLSLTNTSLVGEIPSFLGNMTSLSLLRLAYNKLGGGIPSSFSSSNLQEFQANNQIGPMLSGTLDAVGGMQSLRVLWLHQNDFSGTLPPGLSEATSLSDLRLNGNELVGQIPLSYSELAFKVFAVENNNLDGPIPSFNASTFTYDNNLFCQPTPGLPCAPQVATLLDFLGSFNYPSRLVKSWKGNDPCASWTGVGCDPNGNVVSINLAYNNISGAISPSIANLTSLATLKLNDNNITGTIPTSLVGLVSLKNLDVSNNNITGPTLTFANGVNVNTEGNPFINVDVPPTTTTPDSTNSDSASSSKTHSSKPQSFNVLLIVVSSLVVGLTSIIATGYFIYVKYYMDPKSSDSVKLPVSTDQLKDGSNQNTSSNGKSVMQIDDGGLTLNMKTLERATSNFSPDNFLGEGGFGSVYKGYLDDGSIIAVKRMETSVMSHQGVKEFQSEIAVLSKLRHRHLVAILGYCVEGDQKALVYEYMSGGTLSQHLFEWSQRGMKPLSWKTRLSVALDVALGLEYLHGLAQNSFIHRDLKPSNILLDDKRRAKISDFGLVRLVPDGERQSVQTMVAGTFGYLAPEYAFTGHITTKGDVFSFGVVLMELITGRRALDNSQPEEQRHLMPWFRRVIGKKDRLLEALDSTILLDDLEMTQRSIYTVSQLAGHCTGREPSTRPDMSHVVNVLTPLVRAWKPSDNLEDDEDDEVPISHEELRRRLLCLDDYTMSMNLNDKTCSSSRAILFGSDNSSHN